MTVSKIASKIYQTAKATVTGVWNWRLEWSKAMKQAWREVMSNSTKKVVSWETADGREVVYTAELILSEEINADGHKVTVDYCEIEEKITIGGKTEMGWWKNPIPAAKKVGAVKQYGSLAIRQDNYSQIEAAMDTLKSHPIWIAKQAQIAKNQAEIEEMEKSRRRNGYCEKCGSYCYGDCEA